MSLCAHACAHAHPTPGYYTSNRRTHHACAKTNAAPGHARVRLTSWPGKAPLRTARADGDGEALTPRCTLGASALGDNPALLGLRLGTVSGRAAGRPRSRGASTWISASACKRCARAAVRGGCRG